MAIGAAGAGRPGAIDDGGEGVGREADHGVDVKGVGVGRGGEGALPRRADAPRARGVEPRTIDAERELRAGQRGGRVQVCETAGTQVFRRQPQTWKKNKKTIKNTQTIRRKGRTVSLTLT